MGIEINLLRNYPKTSRDTKARAGSKTDHDRALAQKFGKEFFDGDRSHGYGGFYYNARFWEPVVPDFQKHWSLSDGDSILDIGCAKGFMIYDMKRLIPGLKVKGIDVSSYAIDNSLPEVREFCQIGNAISLPFEDNSIDYGISITTLHNLDGDDLERGFKEIERVSRKGSFITVDAYRNDEEKEAMFAWNLTAKTIMHVDEWKVFFQDVGYTGDYFWFMP